MPKNKDYKLVEAEKFSELVYNTFGSSLEQARDAEVRVGVEDGVIVTSLVHLHRFSKPNSKAKKFTIIARCNDPRAAGLAADTIRHFWAPESSRPVK